MEEIFEYEGQEFTLAEVQSAAEAKGLNINDYTKQYNISRKKGKTTPPQEEQGATAEVTTAPEIQPTVSDFKPVNISLASPEQSKTGTVSPTIDIPEIEKNKNSFEYKNNISFKPIDKGIVFDDIESYFNNIDFDKASVKETNDFIKKSYEDLISKNKELLNFNKEVEKIKEKELENKKNELIQKYDLGYIEDGILYTNSSDPESKIYKEKLNKFNKEYNQFYNNIINEAYQSSEVVKNIANAYQEAIDYKTNEYYSKKQAIDDKAINALIEIIPGLNLLPEGDFRKNLFKLGFTLPQSFEQTASLFNAKEIQDYKNQIELLDTREERIKKQAEEEGWSNEVLNKQLKLFFDPVLNKQIKAESNEEAKKYFENKINTASKDFLNNIVSSNQYQKEINKFGKGPEVFDEDLLTWKDFSGMLGSQVGQIGQAALTFGAGTFIQEAGPAFIEAIDKIAIEKYPNFEELSENEKNEKYLDIIKNNEINYKELIAYAGASAGLDVVGNFVVIGKAIKLAPVSTFRSLLDKLYKPGSTNWNATLRGIKGGIVKAAEAIAVELPTELAQETFNILSVGAITKPLTNNKVDYDWSKKRYLETAAQTILTTGPLVSAGRTVKDVVREGVRQISAGDVGSLRNIINKQKEALDIAVEVKKKNNTLTQKDIDFVSEEKDYLNEFENIINDTKYAKYEPEPLEELIDISTEQIKLQRKNNELKEQSLAFIDEPFGKGIIAKNEERIQELEYEKKKVDALQYYLVDGKRFSGYVNNNPKKFDKFRSFDFNSINEAKEFLISQKIDLSQPYIQDLLNGKSFGITIPNKKIFLNVKENVKNATDALNMTVGANVVHHEAGHAIMSTFSDQEMQDIVDKIFDYTINLDPSSQLFKIISAANERVNSYKKDGLAQRALNEEFITSISDFLRVDMLNLGTVSVNDTSALSKIGEYIGELLDRNSEKNFNFSSLEDGQQIIDFLKKYNQFNGKNAIKINLPKLKRVTGRTEEESILASKDLKKVFDGFIQNKDGTKKYNTKEEFQQAPEYFDAYQAIIEPNYELDAEIAKGTTDAGITGQALENFVTAVKENLALRFVKNFDPAKNESLFGWMMGKTPVLQKAKLDIIAEYKKTKALETGLEIKKGEEIVTRDIIDEGISIEEEIDNAISLSERSAKLIEPLETLSKDEKIISSYKNIVEEKLKNLDLDNLNYNKLKDLAPEITQQIFGKNTKAKQEFIRNNAKTLYDLLPLGVMKKAVGLKTATGIQRTLLNNFYKKGERQTMVEGTAAGLNVQEKLPFDKNKFLEVFGAIENQIQDRNQITAIKALETEIGRAMTNRIARKILADQKVEDAIISGLADGKSEAMASRIIVFDKDNNEYKATEVLGEIFKNGDPNTNVNVPFELLWENIVKYASENYTRGAVPWNLKEGLLKNIVWEYYISKKILLLNPEWESVDGAFKGFDPTGKGDLIIRNKKNGKTLKFEIKRNWRAIMGSGTIGYNKNTNEFIKPKNPIEIFEYVAEILKENGFDKNIKEILDAINSNNFNSLTQDQKAIVNKMKKGKLNFKIDLPDVSNIINNYSKGGVDGIIIGEQVYSLTSNINNFNAPNLIGESILNARLKWSGTNENGLTSGTITIDNKLKSQPNEGLALDNLTLASKIINKKLRVFDFDDTLARSKSNVLYAMPDGAKGKLNAEQFAKQGDDLLQQGAEFDFSEFSKVIEGQKGPMFDVAKAILDKRGDEDLFILTARPAEAKYAIQPFLEGLGLPFRLENIIGLGNSSPQAKADWIASKLNLGYNDVYFADDALKNVEAVAKTLSAYDIKYRSQAVKASKSLDIEFNEILQQSTGVEFYKEYSPVKAELLGRGKGRFKFFVPYDADDFVGLLYTTLGKGKTGDAQMEWYKENLLKPFSRGIQQYEAAKQRALRDWADLKAQIEKDVPAGLNKQNETGFRNQDSVRVYIWHTQGVDMTSKEMGMSKSDLNDNLKYVRKNPVLKAFADKLMALNIDGYPDPTTNWTAGDITTDLVSYINDVKRKEYLQPWKDNIDIIFSDKNKNKLKALYGNSYIESLDDMLYRMWNGRNRRVGITKKERAFQDWINNSVGTVMFFNSRSALLQTISAINFINFTDNNPINAAAAFANQKQYWADFSELFNSDFLKQRRSGLQIDINADEIANAAATSRNKAKAALSTILKFGFTPTQIADSFAIASGGATFYRNRINKYLKEGLTQEEAQKKAFEDFQETAEESQQSARPDRISMQQASSLGRTILAWGNTPMQYARIQKKAALDLINGRGDWKTNVSKIMYYGVIQNIIFSALQQGLFALLFSDEEDEKEKERYFKVGNSMLDTFLRGAGIYGAVASTAKNVIMEIIDQAKSSRPDYTQAAIAATTISPPVNSKIRKLISAGKTFTYKQSKEKVFTEGFNLENPAFLAGGQVISAVANIPVDRIVQKADHIYTAMKPETELWQSIALSLGWSEWDLGMIESQIKSSKKTMPKISVKRSSVKSSGLKRTPVKR